MAYSSGEATGKPQLNAKHVGGEVFRVTEEPSTTSILWAELFKEKERTLLREVMTEETVNFAIRDTYQVLCRCLWQPSALKIKRMREGKFIMLLHDYTPPLTSCWTWAKFAKPLYRAGYSVIMVDMPGFGRSYVNQISVCDVSLWRSDDWHIISQMLDELRIRKVDTISCGESCQTVLRLMQRSPHQLGLEHLMRNPIFYRDELFRPPPRRHDIPDFIRDISVEEEGKRQHLDEFFGILRLAAARIWATFDQKTSVKTADTVDFLSRATSNTLCRVGEDGIPKIMLNVTITEISDKDICETQIGALVGGLRFLFPSHNLKDAVVGFFTCQGYFSDPRRFVPAEPVTLKPPLPDLPEVLTPLPPSASAPALLQFESSKTGAEDVRLEARSLSIPAGPQPEARSVSIHASPQPEARSLSIHAGPQSFSSSTPAWPESDGTIKGPNHSMTRSVMLPDDGPRRMNRATDLGQAIKKAKVEIPEPLLKRRNFLLTSKQRQKDLEKKVKPNLDGDLLPEEIEVLKEVCHDSLVTAEIEKSYRNDEKKKFRGLKDQTRQMNLSSGVLRYVGMAAKAMDLAKKRDQAFAMMRRRPDPI